MLAGSWGENIAFNCAQYCFRKSLWNISWLQKNEIKRNFVSNKKTNIPEKNCKKHILQIICSLIKFMSVKNTALMPEVFLVKAHP